jgi:zinc transporter ZupT
VIVLFATSTPLLADSLAHNARAQHKLVALSAGLLLGGFVHLALDAVGLGHIDLGGGAGSLAELAHGEGEQAGHDHASHASASPGHAGHDHSGHDHAGHDHAGHGASEQAHSGHDHSGHDHSGHDHSGHEHDSHAHLDLTDPGLWLAFLGSFFGLLAVQRLLLGRLMAHGHGHGLSEDAEQAKRHALTWRATYVGLALHASLAGLGFGGMLAGQDPTLVWSLLVAMSLHKGTECLSLSTLMQLAEVPRVQFALWMGAFCMLTPTATWLGGTTVVELGSFATYASAVAAGTFLAVSVADLLPEAFHEREHRWGQLGLLVVGALAGAGLPLLLQGDSLERTLQAALESCALRSPALRFRCARARWFRSPLRSTRPARAAEPRRPS